MQLLLAWIVGALFWGWSVRADAQPLSWLVERENHIEYVRDLEPVAAEAAAEQVGPGVAIGYRYRRYRLFSTLEVWGRDGRFVIYRDDEVWPVKEASAATVAGFESLDELSVPWRYRFAPGMIVLVALGVVAFVTAPALGRVLSRR